MKYMGSKRFMLKNGLGELIQEQLPYAKRIVDPFCGAGSVVRFVAEKSFKQIIAGDLQIYAAVLAKAVIGRTHEIDPAPIKKKWLSDVRKRLAKSRLFEKANRLEKKYAKDIKLRVKKSRELCKTPSRVGPIWNAYGGHYFSPKQALIFDYLISSFPKNSPNRDICLAAVITAAARCAASPGHTAQPFQPTETAGKFIKIAWKTDPIKSCETALSEIAPLHAKVRGRALVSDAKKLVSTLRKDDLVIIDPPYSGVQYSRFYHVLETIATGKCGKVTGIGRYPALSERPQSAFSNVGQSLKALEDLISELAKRKATVIFTFPKGECSNGLSGSKVIKVVSKWFEIHGDSRIHEHVVSGKFSTLGGNNKLKLNNDQIKKSRVKSEELLLLLKPKKTKNESAPVCKRDRTGKNITKYLQRHDVD